jgi:hypothetical protein
MAMMRKRDPMTAEDGFHFLRDHAAEYLDQLVAEFHKEENSGLRYWLFELIVEARNPKMLDFFVEYLYGEEADLRDIAMQGLKELDTKEARRILWEANDHIFPDAQETASFQERLLEITGLS